MKDNFDRVSAQRQAFGAATPPPASGQQLNTLSECFLKEYGSTPPEFYLIFLSLCDGLEENGISLYGVGDLASFEGVPHIITENREWSENSELVGYFVWGESGQDLFVSDLTFSNFHEIDRVSLDHYEDFDNGTDMLCHVLEKMIF